MIENMQIIICAAEQSFPSFTGRIVIDMFQGEVGTTEKTEKKRYALKKKVLKESQ